MKGFWRAWLPFFLLMGPFLVGGFALVVYVHNDKPACCCSAGPSEPATVGKST